MTRLPIHGSIATPPNLRDAEDHRKCGNCMAYSGNCEQFNYSVEEDMVCDAWHEDVTVSGSAPAKYDHIDFKPPKSVAEKAERGLELREETGEGGLSQKEAGEKDIGSGVARAISLSKRQDQSPETIRMMTGFFARHSAYKKHHDDEPKGPARISWLLWGGDPGQSWAEKVREQMEKADEKEKEEKKKVKAYKALSASLRSTAEKLKEKDA